MQKVSKALANVFCKLLLIGFGVQIVLGLCWMVANMGQVQQFGDTAHYLEASKTFIGNGYRGILYPLLIMLAQGMEQLVRIPYHCFLYLLQLTMGFFAAWHLLDAVGVKEKYRLCYGSLVMLTVPMAMQCHLAVLPDSLGASFWLLEWAHAIRILRGKDCIKVVNVIKLCTYYVLGVCLLPEFLITGALSVLAVLVRGGVCCWKSGEKRHLLRLVAIGFFFFGGVSIVATAGGGERRSAGSIIASRFAWSYTIEDYGFWREEIWEYIPRESVNSLASYADSIDRIVEKELIANVGEERAEELLLSMAEVSFRRHTKENLVEILWDVYGYGFAPWVLQEQLAGKGYEAYSGRNYEIMRMHTPGLAGYYMNYGCFFFVAGVLLATLLQLLKWLQNVSLSREGRTIDRKNVGKNTTVLLVIGAMVPVLYYSMQGAGMMDYKRTVGVTLLWVVWILKSKEENEQQML